MATTNSISSSEKPPWLPRRSRATGLFHSFSCPVVIASSVPRRGNGPQCYRPHEPRLLRGVLYRGHPALGGADDDQLLGVARSAGYGLDSPAHVVSNASSHGTASDVRSGIPAGYSGSLAEIDIADRVAGQK